MTDGSRTGIWWFLGIAFALAWTAWEIPIRLGVPVGSPMFQVASLPGDFAPAIAAVIVRKWVTGEGFGDAGLRLDLRRWPYLLIAWLLPLAVVGVIALEAMAFSIAHPDFSFRPALAAMTHGHHTPAHLLPYMPYLVVVQLLLKALVLTPVLWGEEFGWRGYLQLRLYPGRPLLAAVVTGIIWGVWHYPLILRGYNYPGHPLLGLLMFPIGTVLLSIIFGWLRERGGSIWVASLAHSATNAVGGSLSLLLFFGVASQTLVGYQGVLAWPPLLALSVWIIWAHHRRSRLAEA